MLGTIKTTKMKKLLLFLAILALCTFVAVAQPKSTATVSGRIIDNYALMVEGAKVYLVAKDDASQKEVVSVKSGTGEGEYELTAPKGEYILHVSCTGYKHFSQSISLTENQTKHLDIRLEEAKKR
jgi:PEGA domain